jgi:acylaminoacyl-peptidase
LDNKAVKSPIFTPDGKSLIWLQRDAGGPHHGAMALMKTTAAPLDSKVSVQVALKNFFLVSGIQFFYLFKKTATTIVDVVRNEIETDNGSKFYGLFNTGFVKRCFASGNRLVLSTNQKNTVNTYVIDIGNSFTIPRKMK